MFWIIVISVLCVIFYYKAIKPLSYWKDRGVPCKKAYPIVGSSSVVLFRRTAFFDYVKQMYREFSKERYFGVHQFNQTALYIRDLKLIKTIAIKDFDQFINHNNFPSTDEPLMSKSLFNLKGQHWRDMRATLSPTFTSSKMKIMFLLISDCAEEFTKYFEKQSDNVQEVEMKDIFTRFTNDAIATAAFGLKCNSLEEKNNLFYEMGNRLTTMSGFGFVSFLLHFLFPKFARFFKLQITPTEVLDFFRRVIKDTITQREKEGLIRPDMIHLLMEARKGKENVHEEKNTGVLTEDESALVQDDKRPKLVLTDEDITAQAVAFFFGGFDTSSSLMCFIAYELAVNPDIQERLQNEIDETLENCNGKLTYEALYQMKYLDMVVSETLRKWPPAFQTDRKCNKTYTIEPEHSWEKPLVIEKDVTVIFPVIGIHHDPQYFPNPDIFDPERFSEENKHKIDPLSYIPFGVGPRLCIASRFALMENKTLIFHLLSKFDIVCTDRTPIPLKVAKSTVNFVAEGGFWMGLKRRERI